MIYRRLAFEELDEAASIDHEGRGHGCNSGRPVKLLGPNFGSPLVFPIRQDERMAPQLVTLRV